MNKILLTTCARGGSKGIPRKNIKILNGKPLIAYTINTGLEFAKIHKADFALSTDDDEIKQVALEYGLKCEYRRPDYLATDTSGKIDAIRDLMEYEELKNGYKYDFIIDMDVTSPLRNVDDIVAALDILISNPEALNIFSVSPASRNPYFNMVEQGSDGFVHVVKRGDQIKSRQQAPIVYDMNASFYIFRRAYFEEGHVISTTPRSLAYVVPHICFDLDEPLDFAVMEIILRENLLDFKL
ncbi:acylneuraminate cytidylyltransferase family protein [Fulvivirga lutea]|uniref:Acylneuraminate cytidylyltransferase family protein n=1 Tax=Fulvivirga lutea TaxID=2810512 RepID=A0A975A026_9BACT|nr:acylneuraminate cytidylyltransferase family protein [Fulvivirga lutea]QSE96816.1 acylneuraminate cytidylyltransferase family protein [Fulvivirga lutea]